MIKYSFVLPISRNDNYTKLCINSIINQDFNKEEYELIIVLNGENSQEIFSLIESQLSESEIIYTIKFLPLGDFAYALNYSISLSKGKYIVRIDNDDINTFDRLKIIDTFISSYPEINFFCTSAYFIDDNGKNLNIDLNFPSKSKEISYYKFLILKSKILHPTVVVKRESFSKYKYSGLRIVEDLDLWLNLFLNNEKMFYINCETLYYRISSVQSSRKIVTYQYAMLTWLKYLLTNFRFFYLFGFIFACIKYFYKKFSKIKIFYI